MNPMKIIEKYYPADSKAYYFLCEHSRRVCEKAVEVARKVPSMNPDIRFIEEASMLHDIGIFLTHEPDIGCYGDKPYICHGYLGRELIEKEGFPRHALVCEKHVGVGLTVTDIDANKLPLPKRDMMPLSIEEKIVCFADKFFSKDPDKLLTEKTVEEARSHILIFGTDKLRHFDELVQLFSGENRAG